MNVSLGYEYEIVNCYVDVRLCIDDGYHYRYPSLFIIYLVKYVFSIAIKPNAIPIFLVLLMII